MTTRESLRRFFAHGIAESSGDSAEHACGNGSIMRLAPVAIRYAGLYPASLQELSGLDGGPPSGANRLGTRRSGRTGRRGRLSLQLAQRVARPGRSTKSLGRGAWPGRLAMPLKDARFLVGRAAGQEVKVAT